MGQALLLLGVLVAGMGLAVEAGLLGPLGVDIGHFSATFSIFSVGTLLLTFALVFARPRMAELFAQPRWLLIGGVLGPIYVVVLTIATPLVGVGMTMVGVLCGQVAGSLLIDHFGWLGSVRRPVDPLRLAALGLILAALWLIH